MYKIKKEKKDEVIFDMNSAFKEVRRMENLASKIRPEKQTIENIT